MVRVQLIHWHWVAQRAYISRSISYSMASSTVILVLTCFSSNTWWHSTYLLFACFDLKVASICWRHIDLTIILYCLFGSGKRGSLCSNCFVSINRRQMNLYLISDFEFVFALLFDCFSSLSLVSCVDSIMI